MDLLRIFSHKLFKSLLVPYRGYFWVWHVAAVGVTAVLVFSGFDWWFFQVTRSETLRGLIMVAGLGGFFVPILMPLFLYLWGLLCNDKHMVRSAVSVVQATIVSWIIIAVYKTFTGRIQPEFLTTQGAQDISHNFQFGFFEHGIFWGWPSHHTAVAVAGATVLCLAWPNRIARVVVIVWALIVAAGAAVGFHWFSDVVAGAIVGVVVGYAVWRDGMLQGMNKPKKAIFLGVKN